MSEKAFLLKEKTHQIIGIAFDILNTVGHGFRKKAYEKALTVAFNEQDIEYVQQQKYNLMYHSVVIGEFIPNLSVFDAVIVEVKTVDKIGKNECGQVLNYLKGTDCKIGLILNFKYPKLQWERIVL